MVGIRGLLRKVREDRRVREVGQELGQGFKIVRGQLKRPKPGALKFAIVRQQPRVSGRGRVLFDQFGQPVSVRNAPTVRSAKKRRRR